jgi:hypothetical protein
MTTYFLHILRIVEKKNDCMKYDTQITWKEEIVAYFRQYSMLWSL